MGRERERQEIKEGKGVPPLLHPRYTSETMGSSVVDVKVDEPNDSIK